MNWKLFISTFFLIFLAELGDKTQLAAMARTATSGSKWTIFSAASLALVFSTLVAVLFGQALTRIVPEKVIRVAAGGLFVLFGLLILRQALAGGKAPAGEVRIGPMSGAVLKAAAQFEEAACADYHALAEKVQAPRLRALLETLAAEERQHVDRLRSAGREHAGVKLDRPAEEAIPSGSSLSPDVAASDEPLLEHAIEHEAAMAGFYHELARITPLAALQRTFELLAREEDSHRRRLEAMREA